MQARSNPVKNCRVPSKKEVRRRLLVDPKLQGAVAIRVVLYWFSCQFMIAVLMFGFKVTSGGEHLAEDVAVFFRCAFFSTLCFLPLVAYDVLRLTHRFAGPIFRFRKAMSDLGNGDHVDPIRFREGDFWPDLETSFNAILKRLDDKRGSAVEDESADSECLVHQ